MPYLASRLSYRELLKSSTDSASLVVDIKNNFFVLGLEFAKGMFSPFWLSLHLALGANPISHSLFPAFFGS